MTKDNVIHLWGVDGSHDGSITISAQGGVDLSIIQVQLTIAGLQNFDLWWGKVRKEIHDILDKHPTGIVPKDELQSTDA